MSERAEDRIEIGFDITVNLHAAFNMQTNRFLSKTFFIWNLTITVHDDHSTVKTLGNEL